VGSARGCGCGSLGGRLGGGLDARRLGHHEAPEVFHPGGVVVGGEQPVVGRGEAGHGDQRGDGEAHARAHRGEHRVAATRGDGLAAGGDDAGGHGEARHVDGVPPVGEQRHFQSATRRGARDAGAGEVFERATLAVHLHRAVGARREDEARALGAPLHERHARRVEARGVDDEAPGGPQVARLAGQGEILALLEVAHLEHGALPEHGDLERAGGAVLHLGGGEVGALEELKHGLRGVGGDDGAGRDNRGDGGSDGAGVDHRSTSAE
jgi:hypothetical protein